MQFQDRTHAGRLLSGKLEHYRDNPDVIVLALPRGGVPVAFEVAKALDAPVLRNYVVSHATAGLPTNDYAPAGAVTSEYS